jgi:hypothetical protein
MPCHHRIKDMVENRTGPTRLPTRILSEKIEKRTCMAPCDPRPPAVSVRPRRHSWQGQSNAPAAPALAPPAPPDAPAPPAPPPFPPPSEAPALAPPASDGSPVASPPAAHRPDQGQCVLCGAFSAFDERETNEMTIKMSRTRELHALVQTIMGPRPPYTKLCHQPS